VQYYLAELFTVDFSKFKENFNLSSVLAFIIRFRKLVSALARTDLKLPDKAYIFLFINAFQSTYTSWADRQQALAKARNSTVTLDGLYADITHVIQIL
jgi:hypothetical protein